MSQSSFVDGADASSNAFDVGSQTSSHAGVSGGDSGAGNDAQWWLTPKSEYVKLGAVDPAIFGLDISDVGGEPEEHGKQAVPPPTESMFAAAPVSAGTVKPRSFSEWMDDPLGRGKPAKAEPKKATPEGTNKKEPAKTPPKHVVRNGAQGTGIASPRMFDMGDQVIGERSTKEFPIFNTDQTYEASVLTLQYSGHPSISVASRPDRLRPSHEGIPSPIVLAFNPTSEEAVSGVIMATIRWQMNHRPQEEIRIPVTAIAHHRGTQTHQQRQADAANSKEAAADADRAAKEQSDINQKVKERGELEVFPESAGHRERLEQLAREYGAAIVALYTQRKLAIDEAGKKIDGYTRRVPPVVPSLISQLAWAALDSVSYGMASNISGLLSAALSKPGIDGTLDLRRAERPLIGPRREDVETKISPAIVTLVSQAAKQGLKSAGAAAVGAMKGTPSGPSGSTASSQDAVAEFITAQSQTFYAKYASIAENLSNQLYNTIMVTTMKTNPAGALEAMRAATAAINAEADAAFDVQFQSTLQHWVSYVAQTSLGSDVADDGSTVIDMAPANRTAGEHPANAGGDDQPVLKKFDGLVDLAFVVNSARPEEPARLVSAKINGVRQAVADSLVSNGRLKPGVAVRAYGMAGGGSAVTPLTIVRDESGAITFTDHMRLQWEEQNWLSRKAGQLHASPEAQEEGARLLLGELLSQPLPNVERGGPRGNSHQVRSLQTDSED